MNLFKTYYFKWWQVGIFKLALLSIGIIIGTYWYDFFSTNIVFILIIAIITTAYISYISFKQ